MHPRLDAGETSNPETPTDSDQSVKKNILLSIARGPGRGQPSETETFRYWLPYSIQIPWRTHGPTLTQTAKAWL